MDVCGSDVFVWCLWISWCDDAMMPCKPNILFFNGMIFFAWIWSIFLAWFISDANVLIIFGRQLGKFGRVSGWGLCRRRARSGRLELKQLVALCGVGLTLGLGCIGWFQDGRCIVKVRIAGAMCVDCVDQMEAWTTYCPTRKTWWL